MTVTAGDRLSPMPTPHSRRGRRRGPRVVLVTVLLLLGPVLVLELLVRGLIATDRLPTAASNNPQLDVNLIQVGQLPAQDVLLVGDSQIATGLDPAVLEKLLTTEGGRPVSVYNFGQPGSTPDTNQLVLERLIAEGRKPKVIVMDIAMSSLAAYRTGREAEDELAAGPVGEEEVDREGRPTLYASALGRELAGCGVETEIVERLDCELAHVSAAWRWHGRPQALIRSVLFGARLDAKAERGTLRKDGFFARHAATAKQLRAQIEAGDYSLEKVNPAFNPVEADRFKRFGAWAEAQGIEVVYIAWPLTVPYTDELVARNPDWLAQRRAATEQLAAYLEHPIVYVESYGDWFGDGSASDLNHLSAEGAKPFTRQLWQTDDFRTQLIAALGAG